MVPALLGTLATVTVSGWMSETDRFFGVGWVSRLHRLSTDVPLGLIGCHLPGVLVASVLHRENLILAMITGRKPAALQHEHDRRAARCRRRRPAPAGWRCRTGGCRGLG